MRHWRILICLIASVLTSLSAERAPNVIFILADDLGYGDVAAYGQRKIRTPNIDRLAAEGMRFTQHYSGSPVCAPSRCVLMTGKHPGHAIVRDNRELKPEGQFPLPTNTFTLLRAFQTRGWATGAFGKWGLGGPGSTGDPLHQGVDRFFGYNCQRVAHNFYPTSLWDNVKIFPLNNPPFSAHQKLPAGADPNDPNSYTAFTGKDFAPDLIADQAIRFIRDNKDRPFFLYFPTTIPHLALQVPEDSLAEYRGAFPDEPYTGGKNYLPHKTPRAAYAAMVTRLDSYIGRMMQTVADLGLDRDTIFIFTSDNGPPPDRLGGTDADFFESAKNLRGRKGSVYEGGVRVPCIVRWQGRIATNAVSDRVTGFEDWLPTLLELCNLQKDIPTHLDGISFAPTLLGKTQPERPFLYREFAAYGGQQSIRVGDWKAIRQNLQRPAQPIGAELYNLAKDPTESTDLAKTEPEMLAKLERLMAGQHVPSPDFPIRALDRQSNP
jgi:arylsulfatase A-like enzyme